MAGNATHRGEDGLVLDATGNDLLAHHPVSLDLASGVGRVTGTSGNKYQALDEHDLDYPERCEPASRGVHKRLRASVMTLRRVSKPGAAASSEGSGAGA